jgi:hypothetical protein
VRRYDDPVEVRRGWVEGPAHRGEGPEQFLWRGRLWKVRTVLAHWVETGPWWQAPGVRAVIGSDDPVAPVAPGAQPDAGLRSSGGLATDLLVERELWRVEAGRGHAGSHLTDHEAGGDGHGVFDLSFDWEAGSWQLVGCLD